MTAAERRSEVIDHATARRIAFQLRPGARQDSLLALGLGDLIRTGSISIHLKDRLHAHAFSPDHETRLYSFKLLQYVIARGRARGPVASNFSEICDRIDRGDAMFLELHDQLNERDGFSVAPTSAASGAPPVAMARHDSATGTIRLILDTETAKAAIHAITSSAIDREAHIRQVNQQGQSFPEESYARRNREAIAADEARTATRLRAIEWAYRDALHRDAGPAEQSDHARPADRASEREFEAE